MAYKRGKVVAPIRKSADVGPDYPEQLYRNPWGGDLDSDFGNESDKTICSPNGTTFKGGDIPLHHSYDSYYPGQKGKK